MDKRKLSEKQLKFIAAFDGNGTEAARKAGYSGDDKALSVISCKLLGNARIAAAIQKRQEKEIRPLIATRQRRQEFWTKVMDDSGEDMRNRLKASELLGKSEGDFIDRVQVSDSENEDLRDLSDDELKARKKALDAKRRS